MANKSKYLSNTHLAEKVDISEGRVLKTNYIHKFGRNPSVGGKTETTYYLQAADDFYRLGNENPLNVPSDVPMFKGKGDFRMRVGIRSKQYEIQPEVKVKNMASSPYSIKPGTKKKNPLTDLKDT
jgi:hypothetical protein